MMDKREICIRILRGDRDVIEEHINGDDVGILHNIMLHKNEIDLDRIILRDIDSLNKAIFYLDIEKYLDILVKNERMFGLFIYKGDEKYIIQILKDNHNSKYWHYTFDCHGNKYMDLLMELLSNYDGAHYSSFVNLVAKYGTYEEVYKIFNGINFILCNDFKMDSLFILMKRNDDGFYDIINQFKYLITNSYDKYFIIQYLNMVYVEMVMNLGGVDSRMELLYEERLCKENMSLIE